MKSFVSSLGWVLFLLLAVAFLLFYNLVYVPKADRISRQRQENTMWTSQVQELRDSIATLAAASDTAYRVTFTFNELFSDMASMALSSEGEAILKTYVPTLMKSTGMVHVVGHTDNSPVPKSAADRYASNWEYAAARAGAVARVLIGAGVPQSRVALISYADTRPVGDNATLDGRAGNRRIDILVLNK